MYNPLLIEQIVTYVQLETFSLRDKNSFVFLKIVEKLLKYLNHKLMFLNIFCGHHLKVPWESLAFITSYTTTLNKIKALSLLISYL